MANVPDIVTGGGEGLVRQYAEKVYGMPPEQVVGTAGATTVRLTTGARGVAFSFLWGGGEDGPPHQGNRSSCYNEQQWREGGRAMSSHDRPKAYEAAANGGRPADAQVQRRGDGRAPDAAGAARRCRARVRLRSAAGLPDTKVGAFKPDACTTRRSAKGSGR